MGPPLPGPRSGARPPAIAPGARAKLSGRRRYCRSRWPRRQREHVVHLDLNLRSGTSRIALAYSVRLSRWIGSRPRILPGGGRPVDSFLKPCDESFESRLIRPRHALRRHHLAAQLADHFSHGSAPSDSFSRSMLSSMRPPVLSFWLVAVIRAPTRILFSFPGAQAAILRPTAWKSASRPSQIC